MRCVMALFSDCGCAPTAEYSRDEGFYASRDAEEGCWHRDRWWQETSKVQPFLVGRTESRARGLRGQVISVCR